MIQCLSRAVPRVSASGAVARAGMAMDAIEPLRAAAPGHHFVNEGFMAADAVHPDDVAIAQRDLDRLLEVLKREGGRMPEAVLGLRRPFRDPRVRQMTFDAGRCVPVTALEPGVVLLVH